MTANLLTLNPSKIDFMLIGLHQQLSNTSLSLPSTHPILPCTSARNLEFTFDSSHSYVKQISDLSSTCHYHICDLRRIRHTFWLQQCSTIATSLVHSRLDYCNSLYYSFHLPSFIVSNPFKCASTSCISYPSSHSHHSNIVVSSLAQDWTTYSI